jgi:uncharacterized protein (TIGR00297 family)
MAERALIGALVAAVITALARRLGMLSESGQWGAMACGVVAAMAGWAWAAVLIAYFAAGTGVTLLGAARKAERTARVVPQVSARTASQVLANGALFTLLAFGAGASWASPLASAAAGALAAASADTWATEIGTLWGGTPRSIARWTPVAPGMSGGVTLTGTVAAVAGAALVAVAASLLDPRAGQADFALAVVGGGFAGAMFDSLLGGTLQARRWCDHCKEWTERRVHPCNYRTVHAVGLRWLSNDVVNATATVVGAASTAGIQRALG